MRNGLVLLFAVIAVFLVIWVPVRLLMAQEGSAGRVELSWRENGERRSAAFDPPLNGQYLIFVSPATTTFYWFQEGVTPPPGETLTFHPDGGKWLHRGRPGDMNDDGKVNVTDAIVLLQFLVGIR